MTAHSRVRAINVFTENLSNSSSILILKYFDVEVDEDVVSLFELVEATG